MNNTKTDLKRDIERVNRILIIPTLLDVICQTTGMGFAAVARVTETRWITCSVRDDIQFGLVPGSELQIQTTICNEIRGSVQPVVIDHVSENELFCNHHTPLMYGFQSYISYPIVLKTGEFFGTLCAIDPAPAQLDNPKIRGLFTAFSDLISFHLQQVQLLEESDYAVRNLSRQLTTSMDENRQYRHISSHTLQEPLRKLRVFSGLLVDALAVSETEKAQHLAIRINNGAERFSNLLKDLSSFSSLQEDNSAFQAIDLEYIVGAVKIELLEKLELKKARVHTGILPTVMGAPQQLEQLFFHLFDNAIKFSSPDRPLVVSVSCQPYTQLESGLGLLEDSSYIKIQVTDNGIGIDQSQLETIFDMFSQLPSQHEQQGVGIGLSICRKIIRNHNGQITIKSNVGKGTTVSIVLPVN